MARIRRTLALCAFPALCLALSAILFWNQRGRSLSASAQAAVPASADNWGLSFPSEGRAPVGNAAAAELSQYDAWYLGDTSQKVLYLTFDCGYENGCTEQILDALKKHSAPATFFVVGHMVQSAPDIVRRMGDEGHIVGNHTFHHPDMSAIADESAFREELESLEALYREATGRELSRRRGSTAWRICARPTPWAIGPCSGPWPMWTGCRTASPRRRRLTPNSCPASTMGRSSSCTLPPPPTPPFWTTC